MLNFIAFTSTLIVFVQIQSAWKGYYVRKYVFDYYAHKWSMEELIKKNEETRNQLQAQQEREERERALLEEKQQEVRRN